MDTTLNTLTFICDTIDTTGIPPTVRQVASHLGCAVSSTHEILTALVNRGLIELAGSTRTITLTEQGLIRLGRI